MSWYDLLWWESRHIRCLLLTYKESFFNLFNKTTVNFPSRLCWEIEQKFADIIFLLFTMHLCPILCKPMYCSMPGFLVLHHLPELAQTHVHGQWYHATISSSVVPFCSCLQSFPASGSFPMNWLFTSGGQSIEPSASAWVLPTNIQDWFPLGLTGSPCSPRDSQEHQFLDAQPSLWSKSHTHACLLEKPYLWL